MTLEGTKPQLSSKTIQGLIIVVVGFGLTWIGVAADQAELSEFVTQGMQFAGNAMEFAGVAYAWYGRLKATQKIG